MNKDNNPKKSDDAATKSESSKVGDVFPSTSLEEYANKSGRVSGIVGLGNVPDHVHDDDDESGHGSDEDHSGDDEHDLMTVVMMSMIFAKTVVQMNHLNCQNKLNTVAVLTILILL